MKVATKVTSGAAVVIPARLQSSRFPRKVLARETGKYLIQHVYEGVAGAPGITRVIIATDSEEIHAAAQSFGAEVRWTSPRHLSGTDRVAEVACSLTESLIINVQGDEPLIAREDLGHLVEALSAGGPRAAPMATLARQRQDAEGQLDPNNVKVVVGLNGQALYFSRAPIPYVRRGEGEVVEESPWLHHIGVYGYRRKFLETFTRLPPGRLEKLEKLEQLRALENGFAIQVVETRQVYAGIDTEEEYRTFVKWYRDRSAKLI